MSNIGTLEVKEDQDGYKARGRIETIKTQLTFLVSPVEAGRDNAPTHKIEIKAGERYVVVGDAWANMMQRGDNAGKVMFSLSFTDPDLPEWMRNIAAFPTGASADGAEIYEITQSRKRQNAEQEAS